MTLDSNIIIALLDKEESVVTEISRFQEMGFTFFLPIVTESEVLSYTKWTDVERSIVEKFLEENFTSIPFDRALARIVANMRWQTKIKTPDAIYPQARRKRRLTFIFFECRGYILKNFRKPAAFEYIIAATALLTRTPLITRNLKDFKNISGLHILTM